MAWEDTQYWNDEAGDWEGEQRFAEDEAMPQAPPAYEGNYTYAPSYPADAIIPYNGGKSQGQNLISTGGNLSVPSTPSAKVSNPYGAMVGPQSNKTIPYPTSAHFANMNAGAAGPSVFDKGITNVTAMAPPPEPTLFKTTPRDEGRITELTAQKAAPGLRAMRAAIQKVTGRNYENPNYKRMTLREALAGYGEGLGSVMSNAQTTGLNQYNLEYGQQLNTELLNWKATEDYKQKFGPWADILKKVSPGANNPVTKAWAKTKEEYNKALGR